MSEDLLLGRCPTCGLVKDEMHLYIGRLAHEKIQLVEILADICAIDKAHAEIYNTLDADQIELLARVVESMK